MRISEWMTIKHMKQTELAEKLNTSQGFLSEILAGKKKISPEMAAKVVEISEGKVSLEEALFPDKFKSACNE